MIGHPPSARALRCVAAASVSSGLWAALALVGWPRLAAVCGAIAIGLALVVLAHLVRLLETRR